MPRLGLLGERGERHVHRLDHDGAALVHPEPAQAAQHLVGRPGEDVELDRDSVRVAGPLGEHQQVEDVTIPGEQFEGLLGELRRAHQANVEHLHSASDTIMPVRTGEAGKAGPAAQAG